MKPAKYPCCLLTGIQILIFLLVVTVSSGKDLTAREEVSLLGLLERAQAEAKLPQQPGIMPALNRTQLGATIVFLAENNIVGDRVASFLSAVDASLGEAKITYLIQFKDERRSMLNKLSSHAMMMYIPENKVSFTPLPTELLGRERSLTSLVAEAEMRLTKQTGFKFQQRFPRLVQ